MGVPTPLACRPQPSVPHLPLPRRFVSRQAPFACCRYMGDTAASKARCFCVLYVVHLVQILLRTATLSLLAATQGWLAAVYLVGDLVVMVAARSLAWMVSIPRLLSRSTSSRVAHWRWAHAYERRAYCIGQGTRTSSNYLGCSWTTTRRRERFTSSCRGTLWASSKIIQMDVKPANILISADGTARLGDCDVSQEMVTCTSAAYTATSVQTRLEFARIRRARADPDGRLGEDGHVCIRRNGQGCCSGGQW